MNKLTVKQTLFFIIGMATFGAGSLHATSSQERLQQLLQNRPELAQQFLDKAVKQKQPTKTEQFKTAAPKSKPVEKLVVQQPIEQPKLIEKPWMTDQEKQNIDTVLTNLEIYATRMYGCLDAFFSKANSVPYKTHAANFRSEQANLQKNLLQVFPRAQSPEQQKLFSTLYTLTQSFDQTQALFCRLVDQNYASSIRGVMSIANEFLKVRSSLLKQQTVAGQHMNTIRGELKSPHGREMLGRINRLQPAMTKVFNYGQDKSATELYSIMKHRLAR